MSQQILIVEDEADIRELLRFNLEREGFTVHGRILVVVLRFFVLALGGNTRGNVGHAHGRTCGVDALPAGAAGTENIHADVGFLDVQLDIVAHVGDYVHRGKGGVAAAR